MRLLIALLAALLTAGAATVSVQPQQSSLTGTWVATKDTPPTLPAAPNAVFGERFGLRQEGKNMALIRPILDRATALTRMFPTDGTETAVFSFSRPCIGQSGQLVSMSWEGDVLRYTIHGTFAPGATTPTRSANPFGYRYRSISADAISVETRIRDAASGEIREAGTVYRRTSAALPEDPPAGPKAPPIARLGSARWGGSQATGLMRRRRAALKSVGQPALEAA